MKEIITKHGSLAINKEVYIFPVYRNEMSENTKRNTKKQFTKRMNTYLKAVALQVVLTEETANSISTYYADIVLQPY